MTNNYLELQILKFLNIGFCHYLGVSFTIGQWVVLGTLLNTMGILMGFSLLLNPIR